MVLRCTAKALDLLGGRRLSLVDAPPSDDDWYLNLLWFDRRKCLLLTHAGTAFSIFVGDVRKADLAPLGPYVVEAITAALRTTTAAAIRILSSSFANDGPHALLKLPPGAQ